MSGGAFVLAVWVAGYYQGGFSMQEFKDKSSCELAASEIEKSVSGNFTVVKYVCVEK